MRNSSGEGNLKDHVTQLLDEVVEFLIGRYDDPGKLLKALAALYPARLVIADLGEPGDSARAGDAAKEREERVKADAHAAYQRHEQFMGQAEMRATERRIISSLLSSNWSQHLSALEAMRTATGSGLSRDDWLSAYSTEASKRYTAMVERIKEDVVGYVLHSEPGMYGPG